MKIIIRDYLCVLLNLFSIIRSTGWLYHVLSTLCVSVSNISFRFIKKLYIVLFTIKLNFQRETSISSVSWVLIHWKWNMLLLLNLVIMNKNLTINS